MLTVFGTKGGADVFWCGFRIAGYSMSGVLSPITQFIGPLPFKLPPNNGREYFISEDGFGLAGEEIPIGYLESERFPYGVPKPCQHLNATGTIIAKPSSGYPVFGIGGFSDWNGGATYLSPSTSGQKVKQFIGNPCPNGRSYYWKRDGSVALNASTEFSNQMYNGFPIRNLPPDGTIPYRHGLRVYQAVAPYSFSQRYRHFLFNVSLPSLSEFRFKSDMHDLLLSGPKDRGTHYNFEGSFKMTKIRGNTDGTFSILGDYTSKMSWYYIDSYGHLFPQDDVVVKTSTWRYLHIISKTPVTSASGWVTTVLEDQLFDYERLAKALYSEELMTVARSNAIADITALKSNNLENISGLKGSVSIVSTLVQGYKAIVNGDIGGGIKALSSAYLWYSYALAPTISDSKDIAKNTDRIIELVSKNRFSNERRRGRVQQTDDKVGEIQYNVTYHTRLKDNYYSQLYSALQRVGLHPSISQGWDFIPFSFVVDWFISIGPILNKLDDYNNLVLTRDIKSRIESFKATKTENLRTSLDSSIYQWVGQYEQSYYQRLIHSGPGVVDPFSGQTSAGNRSSQMLQGASLLVQQLD